MRVAVYYRVSTDRQELVSQKHAFEIWMENLPEPPKKVLVFEDAGRSGKTMNRQGFQRMLHAAFRMEFDTLVVFALDRFSRDATSAIRTILKLDQAGIAFVSLTQPALNLGHEMPFRRTILSAFAEIAQIEREMIVARIKAGLAAARKRGAILGRPVKMTEEVMEEIIMLRLENLSYSEIANKLDISTGSVCRIIRAAGVQKTR